MKGIEIPIHVELINYDNDIVLILLCYLGNEVLRKLILYYFGEKRMEDCSEESHWRTLPMIALKSEMNLDMILEIWWDEQLLVLVASSEC